MSDLKLFLIKGARCEENETRFPYKGDSHTREPTVYTVEYTVTYLKSSWSFSASCFRFLSALEITFQLLFESIKCGELSDINGNIISSF